MSKFEKSKEDSDDYVYLGQEDSKGQHACLRYKDGALWAGKIAPIKEGQVLNGLDLVQLEHVGPGSIYKASTLALEGRPGPAKVTTPNYREGWDRIFGGPSTVGVA